MARISELDLPERLASYVPRSVTQLGFGLLCAMLCFGARLLLNLVAPGAAPLALIFPAVMLATLLARWPAGVVTTAVALSYVTFSTAPVAPIAPAAIGVATVALAGMIAIAEGFRRAVRRATAERDRQIAERDLFLDEFDHRVKNNFAVVASLLELQRRRSADPATQEALAIALGRVESIARAHRHLYRGGSTADVEIRDYLAELCTALADALFLHGTIRLTCRSDSAAMPRDRAVSIGLVVNELVTNAVKHAFAGRDRGTIEVSFRCGDNGAAVIVADDGIGLAAAPAPASDGGLGGRLVEAFARQAGGALTTDSDATGTRVTLALG